MNRSIITSKFSGLVSLLILCGLATPQLAAQFVSYTISGQIVSGGFSTTAVKSEFPVGTAWNAVIEWDTGASALGTPSGTQAQYRLTEFTLNMAGQSGNWTTSAIPNTASFTQNYEAGGTLHKTQFTTAWGPTNVTNQVLADLAPYSINVILSDPTATAIPSLTPAPDSLDSDDWDLSYPGSQLKIYLNNGGNQTLFGDIQSISVTGSSVPEPSAYTLFAGLGVLGLTVFRRRR